MARIYFCAAKFNTLWKKLQALGLQESGGEYAQVAAHFRENLARALEVGALVRRRDDRAQAGLALRHCGVADGRNVNPRLVEAA